MPRILIVTGEASGDLHGANLAKALKSLDPTVSLVGIGGAAMQAAGVQLIREHARLDVMGMVGPAAVLAVARRMLAMRRLFRSGRWDAVVLIDHPGLNLRYAYFAKAAGWRVVYYIAPQIWAWRPGRIYWIKRRVDHVIVILPFEKAIYDRAEIPCTFVGHPLLDAVAPAYDRDRLRRRLGLVERGRVVGLLPGSRAAEVQALLPILLQAAEQLKRQEPSMQFLLAQASTIQDNLVQALLRESPVSVTTVKELASEVMAASDLILVASGTATLQAAVVGTPMVLIYRTTPVTYWLARRLIRVKWIGLVNLVANRSVIPELIQDAATARQISDEARRILDDPSVYDEMTRNLAQVKAQLGEPGASIRAAQVVLDICKA